MPKRKDPSTDPIGSASTPPPPPISITNGDDPRGNLAEAAARDPLAVQWAKRGELHERLIFLLERDHKFALGEDDQLYVYRDGVYVEVHRRWIRDKLRKLLEGPGVGMRHMSSRLISEVEELVKACKPKLWEAPPSSKMCIDGGVFNFETGTLEKHSPEWLSIIKMDVRYDPKAKCPETDKLFATIFRPDCINLMWEVAGSCATADRLVQKAIWLEGTGANGKSTWMFWLCGVLGKENVAMTSMTELTKDNFSSSDLHHKLAMFDFDASIEKIEDAVIPKKIISGDAIRAQKKYQNSFNYQPFCTLILSGNRSPESRDTSHGFLRKFWIVGMEANFDESVSQETILAKLRTPEEKSGAFNKMIEGWRRLKARGKFDEPESVKETMQSFRREADPIQQFFELFVIEDPVGAIQGEMLVDRYQVWSQKHKKRRMGAIQLGQWIGRQFKGRVKSSQIRESELGDEDSGNSKRERAYRGIRFKDE